MKYFRWKAIVPMALFAALAGILYVLFVDRIVRRTIELVGTEVVGARVEVASARLRLSKGTLEITGMQVTNPNAPMTNLMEIPEISADLDMRALTMKKAVVESLMVHGVRFNTARRESGALPDLPPTAGTVTRRLLAWSSSIPVPTLDLEGVLGTVVNIPALDVDSIRTLREARAFVARGDSIKAAWEGIVVGLDPRPTIDSAQALVSRLQAAEPQRMNAAQLAATANEVRTTIALVREQKSRVTNVRREVDASLGTVRESFAGLDAARRADYAAVRGLVKLPSLDAPDVSLALFGDMVKERLKPVMYWVGIAEEHVPPGLDPRRQSGPKRLRMAGSNYEFPMRDSRPQFLVERGAADLAVGGQTVAAGSYRADFSGLTNEPAVYGLPMVLRASRTSTVGPVHLNVGAIIDRTGRLAIDSLRAFVPGLRIPSFPIPKAGARLDIGDSANMTLSLRRAGPSLAGVWRLESDAVRWLRDADSAAPAAGAPLPRIGTREWAEALLWRSISTLRNVVVEAELAGPLSSPRLTLTSNVGDVVAANLRQALGAEIERAERMIRAEVDQHITAVLAQARAKVQELEGDVARRVGVPEQQLEQLTAQLEDQLKRFTQGVIPGVRLPNIPGLPRRP